MAKLMAIEDDQEPKTIQTSTHSSSLESIPTEIIFEILSRLPVDSLLRCKSVCKSWHSLISDPHFIKYHLTLSTTNHQRLLVCSPMPNLKTCTVSDVFYDHNAINPVEIEYPMKHSCKIVSIVGSCNGLICIAVDRDSVFIWNHSTRKSIKLPDRSRSDGVMLSGFGNNETSDDYKVVEITYCSKDRNNDIVMIYSSRDGFWKEIGGFPHRIWLNDSNVFLNEALHWIANHDSEDSWIIVSLDLAKETYGQVCVPVDDHEVHCDLRLGVLRDCLCVLCDYSGTSRCCVDVWVMKVFGLRDSWVKLVSIPHYRETIPFYWITRFSVPLWFSDDGKLLLRCESKLTVFDSKKDSSLEIHKFNECTGACTFVESLVSPPKP